MGVTRRTKEGRAMAEEVKKAEEAAKAGYQVGKDFDEATGAHDAWATGAYNEDPELAKSAADDWDKGDHAKAIGKFVRASGEALYDAGADFVHGLTGEVEAEAPVLDIPTEPEPIGPETHVEHETMP
jgi:hypothetical protein